MSDIHSALSDAMRRLQSVKAERFFVANGHVFWGRRRDTSLDFFGSKCVVQDASDPEALAAFLNAAIAEERERRVAKCEAEVKAARQAVLDAAA